MPGKCKGGLRLLAVLIAVALCGTVAAQFHRKPAVKPAAVVPAQFDYYALALSWTPEFCARPGAAAENPRECAPGRNTAFVIHGLWPETKAGKGPESCPPGKKVSGAVVNFILPYLLSPARVQQEWATHGACTGLTPSDYFTALLQARAAVQLPVQLTGLKETARETPIQIETQFAGSNPLFPEGAFRTQCRNGAFTGVLVCFDKGPRPQTCPAVAEECGPASVEIKPPI